MAYEHTSTNGSERCSTAVLGGGPAGLAVGYHLAKLGRSPHLFEAESTVGGACRTLEFAGLRFDMGAHRLHNVHPEVTQEVRSLLGDDLAVVDAPSHIIYRGKQLPFPPTPLGAAKVLGLWKMSASVARALVVPRRAARNFREAATAKYGHLVAEAFLVNYSEKLWGLPACELSPEISGRRLQGIDMGSALRDLMGLPHAEHLDGAFLYPRFGFGQITDALGARIPNVHTGARVARLVHANNRIVTVHLADGRQFAPETVVSTLPISTLVRMLEPSPAAFVSTLASSLRFRSVRLAILPVRASAVSCSATLYFPSADVPFTRIYEPKRRSLGMAPADTTCLVLEHPVFPGDAIDALSGRDFLSLARDGLLATGLVSDGSLLDGAECKIVDAYPVLDVGAARRLTFVEDYLRRFTNLHRIGRGASFRYSHFHDLMRDGRVLAERLAGGTA
jgi:protoporphyrinogen oxidase